MTKHGTYVQVTMSWQWPSVPETAVKLGLIRASDCQLVLITLNFAGVKFDLLVEKINHQRIPCP